MKRFIRIILALSGGLILSGAWYEWGSGLLLFIGLIPLLLIEEDISDGGRQKRGFSVYLYVSLSFLTWNFAAAWWIKNASWVGMLFAVIVTSLYTAIPFTLFSFLKHKLGRITGYMALIIFWIGFEFAYNHGEISWPWLSLGNGFMFSTKMVQWYEVTGIFGGTLWVLLVNILIYELIRNARAKTRMQSLYLRITIIGLLISIPIAVSLIRYYTYSETENPREIVVVQPNIDPYLKFNDIPPLEQAMIQVGLAAEHMSDSTDFIVCPETSISNSIWIGHFGRVRELNYIKSFVVANPRLKYITGIMCYQQYTEEERTKTATPLGNTGLYYDSFNSAIMIDTTDSIPVYHKSKLVTGVEKMPYKWLFKPLEKLMLNLGGIFRSHGTMKERLVFEAPDDTIGVAPVICYESIYGEFVNEYIRKGGNYIFVITNDGWWGDTPGHRQHNAFSSLRAIETRRSVARSANTGISSFIDQRGDVLEKLGWWERNAIRRSINANDRLTFYVRHGDYIGRFAFYFSLLLLLSVIYLLLFPVPKRFSR